MDVEHKDKTSTSMLSLVVSVKKTQERHDYDQTISGSRLTTHRQ